MIMMESKFIPAELLRKLCALSGHVGHTTYLNYGWFCDKEEWRTNWNRFAMTESQAGDYIRTSLRGKR